MGLKEDNNTRFSNIGEACSKAQTVGEHFFTGSKTEDVAGDTLTLAYTPKQLDDLKKKYNTLIATIQQFAAALQSIK